MDILSRQILQGFRVDVTIDVTVSLPLKQAARIWQTTHAVRESVIAKVINKQRRVRDKGASESGAGDKYTVARVGSRRVHRRRR